MRRSSRQSVGTIGPSVLIRGDLSTTEDLTIEGRVEGKIDLDQHVLTIGPNARVEAEVLAKVVNVIGKVDGNISATEAINILQTATVDGALCAPRVGIEEGAFFRGQIDISVRIPLQKVIRRLKPQSPPVRFLKRLVVNSISVFRPEADPCPLFGVSPASGRRRFASRTRRITANRNTTSERRRQWRMTWVGLGSR